MPPKKKTTTKQFACDNEVKVIVSKLIGHIKCTKNNHSSKYASIVSGKFLNDWLQLTYHVPTSQPSDIPNSVVNAKVNKPFNVRKNFFICCCLKTIMSKPVKKKHILVDSDQFCIPIAPPRSDTSNPTSNLPKVPELSRAERLFMRNRIPVKDLKGIDKINISFNTTEKKTIDLSHTKYRSRKSSHQQFNEDVLHSSNYCRVPFSNLTMRQRRTRMSDISKRILAACIDRKEFNKDTDGYLHENESLGIEILNLIDGVKENLEKLIKLKFDDLHHVAMVPVDGDPNGLITSLDNQNVNHKVAISLLGETSAKGYERIRTSIQNSTSQLNLPSYYKLTKYRPAIEDVLISLEATEDQNDTLQGNGNDDLVEETEMPSVIPLNESASLDSALIHISNNQEKVSGSMLNGGYSKYIELIETKHKSHGRHINTNEETIILDSFDGAEHLKSSKKITSVISFSTTLYSPSWIRNEIISAGSSLNILTWQQLVGTESSSLILPAVKPYFNQRYLLSQKPSKQSYCFYDIHDGKMLYMLTQHSLWNRKNKPFLLCTCLRGEGVKNNKTHECKVLNEERQLQLYNRSKRRWELKREKEGNMYTKKVHNLWIDENNEGCSHFGISPLLMPRENIRFDCFHLKCAITRRLMVNLRQFILSQSTKLIDDFVGQILSKFWNDFHLYVWKNKKGFSSFVGNELALFVGNIPIITQFLMERLVQNIKVLSIIQGLNKWAEIFKFLAITHLGTMTENEYLIEMTKFKANLVEFYEIGGKSFLLDLHGNKSHETFYMHTLRFYLPRICDITYKRHGVGLGIFTMQGFERRNKESKNCMKRFSNMNGNISKNNLKRLYDVFENDTNAY